MSFTKGFWCCLIAPIAFSAWLLVGGVEAQLPPQPTEIAVLSGVLNNGETIPLPVFANGDTASESQSKWIVSPRTFFVQYGGHVWCYTTGRVVHVVSEGGFNDPATEANYLITAQRQVPPPTFPPTPRSILAANDGVAIDSNGDLYIGVGANNAPCLMNASATLVGNLFGGAPPSPVAGVWQENGSPYVALQNGDLYYWCSHAVPSPGQPVFAGNIFSGAGISAVHVTKQTPSSTAFKNRPNPFNPATEIPFTIAEGGRVTIRVYDASGRVVRTIEDAVRTPGQHLVRWDGLDDTGNAAGSGTYFSRITFPDGTHSDGKMTLVR